MSHSAEISLSNISFGSKKLKNRRLDDVIKIFIFEEFNNFISTHFITKSKSKVARWLTGRASD